jgi:hypothetical protein
MTGGPTLLTNLPLAKEHTGMWASIPSPSCAYLEGFLLSQFFIDARRRRALQALRLLRPLCLSLSLSLSLMGVPLLPPLSIGQRHGEPLSTMAQIYGDGPNSLFLLFDRATSGEAVRTPQLLAARSLSTVVAAAEVMLMLNNDKRSGLYSTNSTLLLSTLPSLLSPVESGSCESGPCASRCEHCIVLSIVSSGLDVLCCALRLFDQMPLQALSLSLSISLCLSVSLSLYICLLCSELDGIHLHVCWS